MARGTSHAPSRTDDRVACEGGYALVPASKLSVRLVLGGGVPFEPADGHVSFELLAKLTAGWVF